MSSKIGCKPSGGPSWARVRGLRCIVGVLNPMGSESSPWGQISISLARDARGPFPWDGLVLLVEALFLGLGVTISQAVCAAKNVTSSYIQARKHNGPRVLRWILRQFAMMACQTKFEPDPLSYLVCTHLLTTTCSHS